MPNWTKASIASQLLTPRTLSWFLSPLASGVRSNTCGSGVTPSACTIKPPPPETPRMLSSKSSCSSRLADQLSARILLRTGSVRSKSWCWGIVRRGPAGKIHTTLSDSPNGL